MLIGGALAARGVTVFMSTHVLEIAGRMCTRVGIIDRGRLIACGTMGELRARARQASATLEDIFLKLTGGTEYEEVIRLLEEEAGREPAPCVEIAAVLAFPGPPIPGGGGG